MPCTDDEPTAPEEGGGWRRRSWFGARALVKQGRALPPFPLRILLRHA